MLLKWLWGLGHGERPQLDSGVLALEMYHGMVWVGRHLEAHPVPTPCYGQGHLPLDQVAPSPVYPAEQLRVGLKRQEASWGTDATPGLELGSSGPQPLRASPPLASLQPVPRCRPRRGQRKAGGSPRRGLSASLPVGPCRGPGLSEAAERMRGDEGAGGSQRGAVFGRCTADWPFAPSPGPRRLPGDWAPVVGAGPCQGEARPWEPGCCWWLEVARNLQHGAAEETQCILKVLCSHDTPFVNKQEVMNHVFEDYHLKMADDQMCMDKADELQLSDMKPGDMEIQQSSEQTSDGVVHGEQCDEISKAKPKWFMSPDNSFRFDFTLSDSDPEATGTPLEKKVPDVSGDEQVQTNVGATEQENGALSFAASAQEPKFAFNFAIADEDCPLSQLVPPSQQTDCTAGHEVLGNSLLAESGSMPQIAALQKPELTQTTGSSPKEDRSHVTLKIPQSETAPGDETVAEKSADGAAKKKKKKQKTSVSKKEIKETEFNRKAKAEASRCQNAGTSHQDEISQSGDQLWKEVDWCVEQLELGLKTQKSTPKQVNEALRAIKTLRSDKAPLVKKRQLMRAMFGDYRKKMEEELCKELKLMEAAVKSARVVKVKRNICKKKGQFIRKCSEACRKSQDSAGCLSESPRTLNTSPFKFTPSQEEFRFNFL